jgi:hypothetical protein
MNENYELCPVPDDYECDINTFEDAIVDMISGWITLLSLCI